jgi:hypothetical protein
MALKRAADTAPFGRDEARMSRRAWRSVTQAWVQTPLKRPLVQILVVVANIQARSLKGEAGKGSTRTLIGRG